MECVCVCASSLTSKKRAARVFHSVYYYYSNKLDQKLNQNGRKEDEETALLQFQSCPKEFGRKETEKETGGRLG